MRLHLVVVLDRLPSVFRLLHSNDGTISVPFYRQVEGIYRLLLNLNAENELYFTLIAGTNVIIYDHHMMISNQSQVVMLIKKLEHKLLTVEDQRYGDTSVEECLRAGRLALEYSAASKNHQSRSRIVLFTWRGGPIGLVKSGVRIRRILSGIDESSLVIDRQTNNLLAPSTPDLDIGAIGGNFMLESMLKTINLQDLLDADILRFPRLKTNLPQFDSSQLVAVRFSEHLQTHVSTEQFIEFKTNQGFNCTHNHGNSIQLSLSWDYAIYLVYRLQVNQAVSSLLVIMDIYLPSILATQLFEMMESHRSGDGGKTPPESIPFPNSTQSNDEKLLKILFNDFSQMRQQDELFSQLYRVNGSEVTILPTLKHELLVATLKNFKIIRKLFFITEESGAAGKIRAWLRKDFGVHDLLLSDSLSISLQSGHLNGTEGKRPWRLIKLEEHLPNLLSLVLFELPVEQSVPDLMISDRIKRRFKITLLPRFEHFYEECLSADNANTIFPKTSKKWMFSTSTLVAVTFDAMVKVRRARDFILIYQKNDSAVLYFAADGGEYDVLCQLRIQGNSLFSRLWWTPYTVPVRRSERNLKDFVRFIIQEDLKAVDKSRLFERACKICKSKTVDCFSSENLYCLLKYADYFFFISNRESSGAGIKNDATSGVQIGVHIYEHHLKQSLAAIHDVGITISRPDQHADSERNLQFLLGEHGVSSYPIGCVYFKLNCDGSLILTTLSTLGCEQLPTDNLPLKETICIFRISPETLKRSQFSIKVKRENFRNGEYSLRAFADSSTNIADSLVAKILLEHRRALLKSKYSELLMGDHVDQSIESLVLSVSSFTDFTVDVFDLVMSAEKAIHGNAAEILDKTFQNMTKVSEKYFSRVSCRSNLFYFPKSCGGNIKEISSCPIFMAREFIFWPSEAVAGSADDFSDFHKLMRFSRLKGSDGLQERLKLRLRVYYLPFLDQTRSSQLDRDRNTPISEAVNLIENEIREGAVKLLLFAEPCIPVLDQVAKYLNPISLEVKFIRRKICIDYMQQGLAEGRIGDYLIRQIGAYYLLTSEIIDGLSSNENDGLGISMSLRLSSSRLCYWLFFNFEGGNNIKIFYHASGDSADRVSYLISKLKSLVERSNRFALLQEMHETRHCSKYLIAPDSHTEELDEVEADLDEDLSVQFKPGELECPLVGRWSFPIHWRFRPQQALNAFSANFLLSFSVSNRNNTFVYAQGDAVFYMRLHEEFGVTNTESLPSTATTFIEYSPLMDSPASASELDRAYSSPLGKISSARSSSDQNQLILEVHGINVPGKEITTDFVSMIESKLSNLTVNVISALLLRNPNLKLTIADLEFITGSSMVFGAQPQLPISLTFPAGFNHITQALNYFRQNIAVYLLPCSGSEAACFVKSRLNLLNQKHEESDMTIEIPITDYFFIYSRPSFSGDFNCGQGIGAVFLNLFDQEDNLIFELSIPPKAKSYRLEGFIAHTGAVNADLLQERVKEIFKCSLQECALEKLANKPSVSTVSDIRELLMNLSEFNYTLVKKSILKARVQPLQAISVMNECKHIIAEKFGFCNIYIRHPTKSRFDYELLAEESLGSYVNYVPPRNDRVELALLIQRYLSSPSSELVTTSTQQSIAVDLIDVEQQPQASARECGGADLMFLNPISITIKLGGKPIRAQIARSVVVLGFYDSAKTAVEFFMYNSSAAARESIDSELERLSYWLDTRNTLLNSFLLQKMGIFCRMKSNIASQDDGLLIKVALRLFRDAEIPADMTVKTADKIFSIYHWLIREMSPSVIPAIVADLPENSSLAHLKMAHATSQLYLRLNLERKRLSSLSKKWGAFEDEDDFENNQTITVTELALFLRKARLIHWCRTPLLFSAMRDRLFLLSGGSWICTHPDLAKPLRLRSRSAANASCGIISPRADDNEMREWFRGMVDAFMDEYVSYLKTLGMQVVLSGCSRIIAKAIADVDQQPSVIPTFSISPDLSIDAPVLYMQKTFGNRVTLMIEIKVQDMFASVNLYTVDYYSLAGADLPKLSNRENSSGPLTRFTEEASAFKNLIHLNSFIYDFHLRFLIDTISDARKVVHWLDFVDVFKAFMRYNSTPANYSRNSIEYGVYRDRCDMSNEELFKYITRGNPFNIHPLIFDGNTAGCFVVSLSENFDDATLEDNLDPHYSLVLFPSSGKDVDKNSAEEVTSSHLSIGYFVLRTYQSNPFPNMTSKSSSLSSAGRSPSINSLIDRALLAVQKIVESAKVYYSRDSLWRRLIASVKSAAVGGIPLENSFTLVDFQMLSTRYHTQPILAIDPDLAELFSIREFNWSFGLDELNKRYYWVAREFRECRKIGEAINSDLIDYPGRKLRHLLLLNPQNSDFVIHFELDSESNLLKVNAVSREVRELSRSHKHIRPTSTSIGTIELEFLSDIARTVSYLMSSQL